MPAVNKITEYFSLLFLVWMLPGKNHPPFNVKRRVHTPDFKNSKKNACYSRRSVLM